MKIAAQVFRRLSISNKVWLLLAAWMFVSGSCVCLALAYLVQSYFLSAISRMSVFCHAQPRLQDLLVAGWLGVSVVCGWIAAVGVIILLHDFFKFAFACFCSSLKQETPIMTNHGNSLLSVMLGIHREPIEYAAVFTDSGAKICEATMLSPSECALPCDQRCYEEDPPGIFVMHNHPLSNDSFSPQDFCCVIEACISRSIVITNRFVYTLELSPECWRLDAKEVKAYCQKLYDQAEKDKSKRWHLQTIRISQQVAEKYGFTFRKERYIMAAWREFLRTLKRH